MNILTINCGSSSVKYQLFSMSNMAILAKGIAEKIGCSDSYISQQKANTTVRIKTQLDDYFKAIRQIVNLLVHPQKGAIKSKTEIDAVGHRVVHGAEEFKSSLVINKYVLERIKYYGRLAPLHNPPAYNGIRAALKIFPRLKQVAVFDTAFHQTMPEEAFMYGLPYDLYKKYGIRRYGFHGTSHRYVIRQAANILRRPLNKLKLISCHLGNGCSIAAIKFGQSIDTSMGFTPLEGLLMGTRCGDIDPALVGYIMEKGKYSIETVNAIMNRGSGLLGLSGISNDMRDLLAQRRKGNKRAKLAIDVFIYRLIKYIGAYLAALNGADAVILTAGIGENVKLIRERIQERLGNILGRNFKILVIPTDEERLIASDTFELVKRRK